MTAVALNLDVAAMPGEVVQAADLARTHAPRDTRRPIRGKLFVRGSFCASEVGDVR